MLFFDVLTLTIAGLLVGNEFAIAAFVHPALYRLPDTVHLAVAPALARVLGKVMPLWYALTVVLVAADAWMHSRILGHWPSLIVASATLWALSVLYSITLEVPINNRVASWTEQPAPTHWRRDRTRWDTLHWWRMLLLTIAFVLLATGLL